MTSELLKTFAIKVSAYPAECARRAKAGEGPISLMSWLSVVARPLQAAMRAEAAAFEGLAAPVGEMRLGFADTRESMNIPHDDENTTTTTTEADYTGIMRGI